LILYTCRERCSSRTVFVVAPLGFYIQHFEERLGGARSFSVAAAVDAILWMATTALALAFILKGQVQHHRRG
jgi:hypothetical protein